MLTFNRFTFAIILIAFGTVLLLDQLGYLSLQWGEFLTTYWPAIFIFAGLDMTLRGLVGLLRKRSSSGFNTFLWGLFWIGVGGAWVSCNLGVLDLTWGDFFIGLIGVALIIFGLNVMFFKPKVTVHIEKKNQDDDFSDDDDETEDDDDDDDDEIDNDDHMKHHFKQMERHTRQMEKKMRELEKHKHHIEREIRHNLKVPMPPKPPAMPSGSKRSGLVGDIKMGSTHWEVNDMDISHGIGSVEIDFAKATFPEKEVTIAITSWAGEVLLTLPQDLPVTVVSSVNAGSMEILGHEVDGMKREFIHVTEGYDDAVTKLKLIIRLGAGNVEINRHV